MAKPSKKSNVNYIDQSHIEQSFQQILTNLQIIIELLGYSSDKH